MVKSLGKLSQYGLNLHLYVFSYNTWLLRWGPGDDTHKPLNPYESKTLGDGIS